MVGQKVKVIAHYLARLRKKRRFGAKLRELDQQAVAQIARGDADRIETLNALKHSFDLFEADIAIAVAHTVENILHRHGEVAGVVHRIDDRCGNGAIGIGKRRQLHLPHQVILQALGGFALVDRQFVVDIVGAGA